MCVCVCVFILLDLLQKDKIVATASVLVHMRWHVLGILINKTLGKAILLTESSECKFGVDGSKKINIWKKKNPQQGKKEKKGGNWENREKIIGRRGRVTKSDSYISE